MIYGNRQTIVTAHNTTLPDDKLHKRTIGWSVGKVAQDFGTASKIDYLREVEGSTPHHDPSPFTSLSMRKIEKQMNDAVANNENWASANTQVVTDQTGLSTVYLHGHKIAEVGDDFLRVFDGGHQTKTTKSRLNALIERFCDAFTDSVYQHKYEWFITDNKNIHKFVNGYTFS